MMLRPWFGLGCMVSLEVVVKLFELATQAASQPESLDEIPAEQRCAERPYYQRQTGNVIHGYVLGMNTCK
jgi:hypothetical protein